MLVWELVKAEMVGVLRDTVLLHSFKTSGRSRRRVKWVGLAGEGEPPRLEGVRAVTDIRRWWSSSSNEQRRMDAVVQHHYAISTLTITMSLLDLPNHGIPHR